MFTKQLVDIVRSFLRSHLIEMVEPKNRYYEWPPGPEVWYRICDHTCQVRDTLVNTIKWWKRKTFNCGTLDKFMCSPCIAAVGGSKEPCISLTGAGILFNQMTKEQIGNIGKLFTGLHRLGMLRH